MPESLEIMAATVDPALLDLPWEIPLEEWPDDTLAALPRGISRHIVRFVNLSDRVIAVKEIGSTVAHHEYEMLRDLSRLGAPSVLPTAVITGRRSVDGEELNAVLVTEHLQFSLPYRALFSQHMSADTATRLIDALAVLLVRLHLLGFYWGDVSLSNTLFRRDAGAFSAYLVDAETGELHPKLTSGQREYDVDLARTNIIGELMDLQAGEYFPADADPIEVGDRIRSRYDELWNELTGTELIDSSQKWKVAQRIERLNDLGFDVAELKMTSVAGSTELMIQPKVVDAGHHHRKLMRLTGMDVGEHQAQRLLNDIATYQATSGTPNIPLELAAHQWLNNAFEPVMRAVPAELKTKLEPAQIYHEFLEHRWYLGEQAGHDVPLEEAIDSYVEKILAAKRDEERFINQAEEETTAASNPDLW
ncbi:Lipopolysaccharide kinase (Kdo/WaaP) family [Chlamydia trachomatis]|nr:Lipopolysaccharide kinase (Kdo/WaaP) family [Chlamydia trachomatis]